MRRRKGGARRTEDGGRRTEVDGAIAHTRPQPCHSIGHSGEAEATSALISNAMRCAPRLYICLLPLLQEDIKHLGSRVFKSTLYLTEMAYKNVVLVGVWMMFQPGLINVPY